ncbi:unnamed protein product [Auanema sp. JU1783]|nr:unnamed protein product [Auanema sp. JU1783]
MSQGDRGRKRKFDQTLTPKQRTPNRPRSPPRKARNFIHKVLLVGFTDKERSNHEKLVVGNIEFVDYLVDGITHIIVKPAAVRIKSFRWIPLYLGVISGACFIRIDWLKKSFEKKQILKEDPYLFKGNDIDIQLNKTGTSTHWISFPEILKLSSEYAAMGDKRIFSDPLFSKVMILCKRTKEGKQKKNELRALIEAGGGSVCADEVFKTIQDRKFADLRSSVTAAFIINGDTLQDIEIDEVFIWRLLTGNVPVMYEEYLRRCIRGKLVLAGEPGLKAMLTNCLYFWQEEHHPNIAFDDETFNYITQGVGKPTLRAFSASRNRSRTKSPLPMEGNTNTIDESLGHITLTDFESEISLNDTSVLNPDSISLPEEEEEEKSTSVIFHDNNLSQTTLSILSDFNVVLGEADMSVFSPKPPRTWINWRAELSLIIPKALALAGIESGEMSANALSSYQMLKSDFGNYEPTTPVHDLICHDTVSFIRHSMTSNFLPNSKILSEMLHNIAMPEYGMRFDSSDSVYKLIAALMKQFPPAHSGGRVYWLKVFSSVEIAKKEEWTPGKIFKAVLKSFREKVFNTFSNGGTNPNLMSLLLMLLEFDLYALQGCGITNSQEAVKPTISSERATRKRSLHNDDVNLEGVPLAYLVLFEPSAYRRRGFDETSKKALSGVIDYVSLHDSNIDMVRNCTRFIAVIIEAVRWYSVEILHCADSDEIPIEMLQDIKSILRYFIKKGWTRSFLKEVFPLVYIHPLIEQLA